MSITKKCASQSLFFNEKKLKYSDDFWLRKLTFKVKFWHLFHTYHTEKDGQKISFLKSAKNVFFSIHFNYFICIFIPKVLLKEQKRQNLRRIKNDEIGPSNLCASLTHFREKKQAKSTDKRTDVWYWVS